jgi:hypothetical protein
MGRIEERGRNIIAGSDSQSQTQVECCWQGLNRRGDQKAVGGNSQSGKCSEGGAGQKEDVTRTKSRIAGEFGESESRQGSKTGGSVGRKENHKSIGKRCRNQLLVSDRYLLSCPQS